MNKFEDNLEKNIEKLNIPSKFDASPGDMEGYDISLEFVMKKTIIIYLIELSIKYGMKI